MIEENQWQETYLGASLKDEYEENSCVNDIAPNICIDDDVLE